jgi:ferrous-iron efflux pump FieF
LLFQRYVISRTSSMAIGADHLHYLGDLAINFAVIIAFGLHQWTGAGWFDPAFALAIAGGLIYSAIHIAEHALMVLMDHELPESDRAKIKAIVESLPDVRGIHDMRTRSDSDRVFMEFHVELDGDMTLRSVHHIDENIMAALRADFPNADILIHVDPAGVKEDRLDEQIEKRAAF